VEQAQHGMLPEHAGSGVAHDDFDLFATGRLIAMDWAVGARGFFRTEAAAFQPEPGVGEEPFTLVAATDVMMGAAIDSDHCRHGFPFARKPLVLERFRRCRLVIESDVIAG